MHQKEFGERRINWKKKWGVYGEEAEVQKSKNGSMRIKGVQGKKAHRVKWVLKKEGGI